MMAEEAEGRRQKAEETSPPEITDAATPKTIRQDGQAKGLLALVVLIGLALRLWGIGWSLPNAQHPSATYHPDERINLKAALLVDIPHGQLDTGFYSYGTLYFYCVSFAHTFGRGWHLIPETPGGQLPAGALSNAVGSAPENAALFLTGRLVTALLGVATIPVVFAIGRLLYGRRAGLMAALLYALAPLAVVHAHFLTVDVPATFFVSLALLWAVRLLDAPTLRNYILAGVWVGLSAATKYNCGLVIVAPLAAHWLNKKADGQSSTRNLLAMLASVAFAFLIACPGPLLNWNVFWNGTYPGSGVRYELFEHSREGHGTLFQNTGLGWWYHLVVSLRYGLGDFLLVAALAGIALAFVRRRPGDRVMLAFFLVYYLAAGLSAVRFARYMLPLFPVLCLFVGRLAGGDSRWSETNAKRVVALGRIVALLTGLYAFTLVRAMTLSDPRDRAAVWLNQNALQGASVAFAKTPWFWSPPLSPRFGLPAAPQREQAANEITRFSLRIPTQEWDASVLTPRPDYVVVSNLESMHDVFRLQQKNAVEWMNQAAKNRPETFGPPFVFGPSITGSLVPEDILYIVPTLQLYPRP